MPTDGRTDAATGDDLAVVTLVRPGRDASLVAGLLRRAEISHRPVSDLAALYDRILAGCGPVVVASEMLRGGTAALGRTLATQPNWSDVPVILFAREHTRLAAEFTPLIDRSNTTLLRRPVQSVTFLTVVRSAVADRERQYAVRDLLDSLERLNRRNRRRIIQLQRLAVQLTRAEERERRRLAGLLHDDLQQLLVGAQFRLNVLERRLRSGRDLGEPLQELGQQITAAIEQSRNLSHELTPPPLRRRSLGEALQWLADRMRSFYRLDVTLEADAELSLDSEDMEIFAYRTVQELLFNVVKHAGTDRAWVRFQADGDHTEILVQDQGRGFDPPSPDAEVSEDPGLGLFSIAERAELLGGGMEVWSEPGAGCRVCLRIPRRPAAHTRAVAPAEPGGPVDASAPPPAAGAAEAAPSAIRVLIVDDHETLREGVKALLAEEHDIAVVGEAANGEQALELTRRRHPDVVLLDVAMPVMDGMEAASRLRQQFPALRILGLSTFGHEEMGQRMLDAGADRYFCKSDPGTELIAAIRDAVRG